MKHITKRILPLICFLVFLFAVPAAAATVTPGTVTNLKVTSSDNKIKLTWNKASKAKGYYIYKVDLATGAATYWKKTSRRYYSFKGSYNVTYSFKVCAYSKTKTKGAFSEVVSVTPTPNAPKTPSSFQLKSKGTSSVTLSWKKVKNASGYVIEQYDSNSGSYTTVKTVSSKTKNVTISGLTAGTSYQFRIRSYRTVNGITVYSSPSSVVTVTTATQSTTTSSVRGPYYTVKVKRNVTAKNLSTGGSITLKKGTKLSVTSKRGSTVKGYLSDGTKIQVSRSALKYTGLDSSSKNDYSKEVKEAYVNGKGFSSKTKYLIWISHYKLKVNVFYGSSGNWTLVKTFPCVVGKWSSRTPGGLHKIISSVYNGSYGAPEMHFTPRAAFHNQVDSTMSAAASHGCCRMRKADLKWLYSYCKVGTTVWSY